MILNPRKLLLHKKEKKINWINFYKRSYINCNKSIWTKWIYKNWISFGKGKKYRQKKKITDKRIKKKLETLNNFILNYFYKFRIYRLIGKLKEKMVREINAEEYAEIINSSSPVVIDFHATWCGPCKVLSPILEELNDEIEGVEFVKLDVDQHPQIAGQNQVMGVPTVVILKDGEVKDRFVGVQPKEVIKEKITSLG